MKRKEEYLDIWTHWVWSYNYIYEKPLEHCPFLDDIEDALDELESYCRIITTEGKRRKKNHIKDNASYENYHPNIQNAIQEVIRILSDGRSMHDTVDVSSLNQPIKIFNHHLDKNGLLPFENDPFDCARRILEDIPEVREIVQSEKKSGDFEQFINNEWYFFEGYESGSSYVRFSKINVTKNGEFTFDGDIIETPTVNTEHNSDGVLFFIDVEDEHFYNLPYVSNEIETSEELIEILKEKETLSLDEIRKNLIQCLDYSLEELK